MSPTDDSTKILAAFAKVAIGGSNSFLTAIQIAQLALKHRKNKAGGQRIVAFVGSPLPDDIDALTKVGKKLRKDNVAVDVIVIGEVAENNDKLAKFIEAASKVDENNSPITGAGGCNLIVVPCGVTPMDALASSPVLHQQGGGYGGGMVGGGGGGGAGSGGAGMDIGYDEALDPDLAMALRISAEESKARVQAQAQSESTSGGLSSSSSSDGARPPLLPDEDDEEALMQRALEMSISDSHGPTAAPSTPAAPIESSAAAAVAMADDDEDEALRMALALSMEQEVGTTGGVSSSSSSSSAAAAAVASVAAPPQPPSDYLDPSALSAMLAEVTGRDMQNDPLILAALEQMRNNDAKEKEGEGKESKKRKDEE